jgi:hypothetical protein
MKEQLVSFQVAKLAKEKYFEEPCIFWYDNNEKLHNHQESGIFNTSALIDKNRGAIGLNNECNIPTQSLLQQWLREVHNLHIEISRTYTTGLYVYQYFIDTENQLFGFQTYEEALEKGLEEALKLIKNEKTTTNIHNRM